MLLLESHPRESGRAASAQLNKTYLKTAPELKEQNQYFPRVAGCARRASRAGGEHDLEPDKKASMTDGPWIYNGP